MSLGPLGTNCYIIQTGTDCLIVDPSGDADVIEKYIQENELHPLAILLTHAHFDHIIALDSIRKTYNIDVYLHENEKDWLENPSLNRSALYFGEKEAIITKRPEKLVSIGDLRIGPFSCEVVHTPGHSPGSVSYIFNEFKSVVSGDVLFKQGIGRTDLPEGSIDELASSIVSKLYTLPDEFVVYPGHGASTTIGEEKSSNPFTLQFYRP